MYGKQIVLVLILFVLFSSNSITHILIIPALVALNCQIMYLGPLKDNIIVLSIHNLATSEICVKKG